MFIHEQGRILKTELTPIWLVILKWVALLNRPVKAKKQFYYQIGITTYSKNTR